MRIQNWIFVTGAPRSGTTFVGKILSAPLEVDYIHEPFNPDCGIPGMEQRFLYLRKGGYGETDYQPLIEKLFEYKISLKTGYFQNDTRWRRLVKSLVGSRGPFHLRMAKLNPFHTAAVIKDPVGCLLAEYLSLHYRVSPVVLIRHPVAFVASIRRIGWPLDLEPIRQQEDLVQQYFSDPRDPLWRSWSDPLDIAAVLWRCLNRILLDQIGRHPHWFFITHEELSRRPLETFQKLYRGLDLPWSSRIARLIRRRTHSRNRLEASFGRVQDFNRNSAGLYAHRMAMLNQSERQRVLDLTGDTALRIYPEESFRHSDERQVTG